MVKKINIVDVIIILVVLGLVFGFIYRSTSKKTTHILSADKPFYVTLVAEKIKDVYTGSVKEGDIFYVQHENILGKAVKVELEKGYEVMRRNDGTSTYAETLKRKNILITIECKGNITESGFFANGTKQLGVGMEVPIKSNMILLSTRVVKVSEVE